MKMIGLVLLCRFLSWPYSSKCKSTVWTRSLLDKPNLKSMHSSLGNRTCDLKLRAWGRLNYLEDLLGQHKPCQTPSQTCTASPAVGECTPLLVQHHRRLPSACRALGTHPVKQFLCGLFLGLASDLCFYSQIQNQSETQPKCQDFLVTDRHQAKNPWFVCFQPKIINHLLCTKNLFQICSKPGLDLPESWSRSAWNWAQLQREVHEPRQTWPKNWGCNETQNQGSFTWFGFGYRHFSRLSYLLWLQ